MKKNFNRREMFLVGSSFLSLPFVGYAGFVEPAQLTVNHVELAIKNLPKSFDGYRIAQLSDFHYRPSFDKELVERSVKEAMAFHPDLITLTGDFIEKKQNTLPDLFSVLAPLNAPDGVFGILGNHDHHGSSKEHLIESFKATNITLLVNDILNLHLSAEKELQIIGLDSIYRSVPDFDLKPERVDDQFRLVLAHEPDMFDQVVGSYEPHLQLSGHTHGGQLRIPFIGYAPFTPPYGRNYIEGEYEKGGCKLFVSTGIGTSMIRMRFACKPEVALLTLRVA